MATKKEVIAIAFSDLHLNNWAKFNHEDSRTLKGFDVLYRVAGLCKKYCCPAIFCGDLFHKPENIDADLYDKVLDEFDKLNLINHRSAFTVYAISGNHDLNHVNTVEDPKSSWVSRFARKYDWLECIDFESVNLRGYHLHGIPYLDHNNGLNNYY